MKTSENENSCGLKKQIVLNRPLGAEKSICVRKSEQIFVYQGMWPSYKITPQI